MHPRSITLLGRIGLAADLLMYAICVPLVALAMYSGAVSGRADLTIVVSAILVVLGIVAAVSGLLLNYRRPRLASLAIGGWTASVVLVSSAVFAALTWLGVRITNSSPDTAPVATQTVAAIAAAVVAAVIALLVQRNTDILAGSVARRFLRRRFYKLFPAQPLGPPVGIDAYRAVRDACDSATSNNWGIRERIALFKTIKPAIDAGAYEGGSSWRLPKVP